MAKSMARLSRTQRYFNEIGTISKNLIHSVRSEVLLATYDGAGLIVTKTYLRTEVFLKK